MTLLPEDDSSVSRNMSERFFYNFNVFLVTIHFVQVSALVG